MQYWKLSAAMLGLLWLSTPVVQAANVTVDCSKKASVSTALGKLDRSVANTITIVGTCTEDVLVSGHRDLTIVGSAGAGIAAASTSSIAVYIESNSRVTLRDLAISGGQQSVYCGGRSTCILNSLSIQAGTGNGVSIQSQSSADVIGNTSITGPTQTGLGVFGASSANVGPNVNISGATANGGGTAVFVQDGSFLRADGGNFSGNDNGVFADRGAVVKLLGSTVTNNSFTNADGVKSGSGVFVRASTVQLGGGTYTGNDFGVVVNDLSYTTFQGNIKVENNTVQQIVCSAPTAITQPKNFPPAIGALCPYAPPSP